MKAFLFILITILNFSFLFSQIDNGQGRYEIRLDTINLFLKQKGNDTVYQIRYCKISKVAIVKNKYVRKSKNNYECKLLYGNVESGKFRNFFLYNNPFKKEKLVEKTGVWKEYDSNGNLVKTIDYSNVETYDGLGIKKSIRLFPYGRYGYIKRNNMNGIKNKYDN
jgi:hypothetical protein